MYNLCFIISLFNPEWIFEKKNESEKECSRIQHFSCIEQFVQSSVCVYVYMCIHILKNMRPDILRSQKGKI